MLDRRRFAHAIEAALPEEGRAQWLAVACLDNADEVRFGVVTAALALRERGHAVYLADLTEQGLLAEAVSTLAPAGQEEQLKVSRPQSIPVLAGTSTDFSAFDSRGENEQVPSLRRNDVSLVLADLDPVSGCRLPDGLD